jgi:hypothetical protein
MDLFYSQLQRLKDLALRHRRKLIATGVVAGVTVIGWQILTNLRAAQEQQINSMDAKLLRRQRIHKYFEQSQETCQGYVRALLPQLHERVGLALELPSPLEMRTAASASKERKYELWNQMKISG